MDTSCRTTQLLSFFLLTLLLLLSYLPTPSSSQSLASSFRCNKQDYAVLMKIKAALHNPYHLASWVPNTDCCEWYIVQCDETTNRITSFSIHDSEISGQIPAEVSDLPYLNALIFRTTPNLTGNIPSTITKLKNLKSLVLDSNSLSGPIPSFLSQLPNLDYITLEKNQFSGSIPSSLSSIPKLDFLNLGFNKLTGPIPESFGKIKQPLYLFLSHNQLSGVIPKSLGDVQFVRIDLSYNYKLEGDVSILFKAKQSQLLTIDLSRNMFEFDLSKAEIAKSLVSFDISHNKIFGSIPQAMTGFYWQHLNVSYNQLCGKIPQGGRMQNYDSFAYYHNKCLCGSPLAACK